MENEFVRVFMAILPRIFSDADSFEGMHWHTHGIRRPNGEWYGMELAFPYPVELAAPDVCTMAGWKSVEALREFTYNGRTHPRHEAFVEPTGSERWSGLCPVVGKAG